MKTDIEKCVICGKEDNGFNHHAIIYKGESFHNAPICPSCENKNGLKVKIIKDETIGKLSNARAAQIINNEGIGYAVQSYIRGSEFSDPITVELWNSADNALCLLEEYLKEEIDANDY